MGKMVLQSFLETLRDCTGLSWRSSWTPTQVQMPADLVLILTLLGRARQATWHTGSPQFKTTNDPRIFTH